MVKFALLVRLKAKVGKELAVENFITKALPLAVDEPDTKTWYALKIDATTFGIFDTFQDEAGREAHLGGKIAAALMANAPELLAEAPVIEKVTILAAKMSK
jgi:quinol monooxygenase YgiN